MSEIEPGTIQDVLAELVACAGVFDVSTNYEADKVSLEKATQAVLDHVRPERRAGMSSVEEQIGSAAWETAPVWCRIAIVAMEQALRDCDILARRKMGKDATWGHIRRFCNQAGVNSEKGVLK